MTKQVLGVYKNESEATEEINRYIEDGYDSKSFSILAKDEESMDHVASETKVQEEHPVNENAFGMFGRFLAGFGGGTIVPGLVTPGMGALIAAGPISSMVNHYSYEDVKDLLLAYGIGKEQADSYTESFESGSILVLYENK
ncbi:general stress protein [Heyndrickxia acidicola]|uniref:General stress protein n=1 Tax=Heyndrickxia acidicola TaxID=209389 RepID=A0ABU6MCI2_9BACI|nr:general stress protein [Heyndrickxia acidicola]MED1201726.1 general stress protein [Heyndrickxia acidicola]